MRKLGKSISLNRIERFINLLIESNNKNENSGPKSILSLGASWRSRNLKN